jgi:hypothetical protein
MTFPTPLSDFWERSVIIFGNVFQDVTYLAFEVIADPRKNGQVNARDLVVAIAVELGWA